MSNKKTSSERVLEIAAIQDLIQEAMDALVPLGFAGCYSRLESVRCTLSEYKDDLEETAQAIEGKAE